MSVFVRELKVAFLFRIPQNEGNSSVASLENKTKRFFESDSQMVPAPPHVSLFWNSTY